MLTQISFQSAHHSSGKVLWTDIGKIIGRQGMNLKIIKAWVQLGWSAQLCGAMGTKGCWKPRCCGSYYDGLAKEQLVGQGRCRNPEIQLGIVA